MTRDQFRKLFTAIFEVSLSDKTTAKIETAQKTRNKILHGKTVSEANKRNAIVSILEYSEAFNREVSAAADFRPFGSLRGFEGAAQSLDKSTSRWVLKGIGLIG